MRTKVFTLVFFICLMFNVKSAYSLLNAEVFGSFSGKPLGSAEDIDYSIGGGFGLGLDLTRLGSSIMLQLKLDAMYHDFNRFAGETKIVVPINLGGRLLFGNDNMPDWLVPYIDVGLMVAITYGYLGSTTSTSGTTILDTGFSVGALFGLGVEIYIWKNMYLTVNARINYSSDIIFWSASPGVGYRF